MNGPPGRQETLRNLPATRSGKWRLRASTGQRRQEERCRYRQKEARQAILVDTGPLVALFDPADASHERCVAVLKTIEVPIVTTIPVLTEAFHLLTPASIGAQRLMDFIVDGGLAVWYLDDAALSRAFELMIRYSDNPMDLADASLVAAAEAERLNKVSAIDRNDFTAYRVKRGYRYHSFEIIA